MKLLLRWKDTEAQAIILLRFNKRTNTVEVEAREAFFLFYSATFLVA